MNLTIISNIPLFVKIHLRFHDPATGYFLAWETSVPLEVNEPARVAVVGRSPQEVASIEMEYNGVRYNWPVEIDKSGEHLKPIDIQDGRDHWSQLLREAALSAGNKD